MYLGSWTYDAHELQLAWYNAKSYIDLTDYSYSGIWDVMDVPGQLIADASKIEFRIVLRRKPLFYTVILIIPTVLMAFLSMMVFYLPAECSEKITLAISILLALVVFLLLVSKILPPTSDTIPLMAKYLLMTFVMNIITILVTVVIINIYFRGPTTHSMPDWVRVVFLQHLPLLLMMKRPPPVTVGGLDLVVMSAQMKSRKKMKKSFESKKNTVAIATDVMHPHYVPGQFIEMSHTQTIHHHPYCQRMEQVVSDQTVDQDESNIKSEELSDEALKAIDAIQYITEHLKGDDRYKKVGGGFVDN